MTTFKSGTNDSGWNSLASTNGTAQEQSKSPSVQNLKKISKPQSKSSCNNSNLERQLSAPTSPTKSGDPAVGLLIKLKCHSKRLSLKGIIAKLDASKLSSSLMDISLNNHRNSIGAKLNTKRNPIVEKQLRSLLLVIVSYLLSRYDEKKCEIITFRLKSLLDSINRMREVLAVYAEDENKMEDIIKYHHSVYVCKIARSGELPPKPKFITNLTSVPELYSGFIKKLIKMAIIHKSVRSIQFVQSLLMTKRVFRSLCSKKDVESLQDHEKLLTQIDDPLLMDDLFEVTRLRHRIEITSQEVFLFGDIVPAMKMIPTTHACFQSKVTEGGTAGLFKPYKPTEHLEEKDFIPYYDEFPQREDDSEETIDEDTGKIDPISKLSITLPIIKMVDVVNNARQDIYNQAYNNVRKRIDDNDPDIMKIRVKLVKEPGKNRPITTGDGFLYTVIQPAQGQLLRLWSRTKFSTMVGDLRDKVQNLYDRSPKKWLWCSADYKSATDTIKMWATQACLDPLAHLPDFDILQKSISPSIIVYPEKKIRGKVVIHEHEVLQNSGQLMGSPLSFPFLCIINLSIYRYTVECWVENTQRYEEGRILLDNCLINGDDMLFRAPSDFIELFYEKIRLIGFIPSQGKNYISKSYATLNSKVFVTRINPSLNKQNMVQCGYLNLPLCEGKILHEGDIPPSPGDIGLALSDMMKYCPFSKYCLSMVINPWKAIFPSGFKPNPFVPSFLGGYGIDPKYKPQNQYEITNQHLRMATAMIRPNSKLRLFRRIDVPGFRKTNLLKKYKTLVGNWKVVPKSELKPEMMKLESDDLVTRLLLSSRLSELGKHPKERLRSNNEITKECALKSLRGITLGKILNITKSTKKGESRLSKERFEDYAAGCEIIDKCYNIPRLHAIIHHGMNMDEVISFREKSHIALRNYPTYGQFIGHMKKIHCEEIPQTKMDQLLNNLHCPLGQIDLW